MWNCFYLSSPAPSSALLLLSSPGSEMCVSYESTALMETDMDEKLKEVIDFWKAMPIKVAHSAASIISRAKEVLSGNRVRGKVFLDELDREEGALISKLNLLYKYIPKEDLEKDSDVAEWINESVLGAGRFRATMEDPTKGLSYRNSRLVDIATGKRLYLFEYEIWPVQQWWPLKPCTFYKVWCLMLDISQ
jgi:hypothetical protein